MLNLIFSENIDQYSKKTICKKFVAELEARTISIDTSTLEKITKASFQKKDPYLMLVSLLLGLRKGQFYDENILSRAIDCLKKNGDHTEVCILQYTAAKSGKYKPDYVVKTFLQLLSYLEVRLAKQLYERQIRRFDGSEKIKESLNFLLLATSLNFELANNLIRQHDLKIYDLYTIHPDIVVGFMDNFSEEDVIDDFVEWYKKEKPTGILFSKFLNWFCQKSKFEKKAHELVCYIYRNFKSNWGKDYLTEKSLIAALIRFEEYDKFCDVRADASHITKEELVGIDFKYNFLKQGPEKDYSKELHVRKSSKRYLGMTTLVYGRKDYADLFALAVLSLTTSTGFAELCNKYNVNITVSTTPELRDTIEKACAPLRNYDLELNVTDAYMRGGNLENKIAITYKQFYRVEKERGIFLALAPDMIYGNGILKIVDDCPEGGAVIAPHVRVSMKHVLESIKSGEVLDILNHADRNLLLSNYAFSKWAHYYQNLWRENRTVQARSEKRNRLLEVTLNGPICILKPSEGFFSKLVTISKLRYNNTYLDHIIQPIDHELLGDFYAQKKLHIIRDSSEFLQVEPSESHGYVSLFKNLVQIPNLPCHEKIRFSIPSDCY